MEENVKSETKFRVILASASPRRRELLAQIGIDFEVVVSEAEENVTSDVPFEIVQELSARKAQAVREMLQQKAQTAQKNCEQATSAGEDVPVCIVGADTIVACEGKILGKPKDEQDAVRMLRLLSGRAHQVYTGVTLLRLQGEMCEMRTFYECTTVHFAPMSEREMEVYVATGDPLDKAGAYGIQGFCARYITGIEGDYNNVVGLPAGRVYQEMKDWL